ncbi:hypothetical protein PYW07_016555 [Mythimna separata]|uniref:Uncharacterized protein n=1 Tax=Mythimna separata TaxID=271217 RepID=A0AAD8DS78_MYTSE|nr:hypothetical protein PYW07_016555 [Mythimna separata]
MLLYGITLLLSVIGSNAEGEFCVLHSPESIAFIRTIDTWESHLKEIYSAALGLSVEYHAEWKGMFIMDPFDTPEAAVEVHVDGLASLSKFAEWNAKIFPLVVDEREPYTFKGIQARIKQHFYDGRNKIVNVKLSGDKRHIAIRRAFGTANVTHKLKPALKLKYLNDAVEEDRYFLREFTALRTIIAKVEFGAIVPDKLIDFYHFRFRTIHLLADFYGPISAKTKEAKKLLGEALEELNDAFVKAYDGSVLVTVVTTDVAHTRRSARSVTNPPGQSKKWPYEWLEPPLDSKKYSLKPTRPTPTQKGEPESANKEAPQSDPDPRETQENETGNKEGDIKKPTKGKQFRVRNDRTGDQGAGGGGRRGEGGGGDSGGKGGGGRVAAREFGGSAEREGSGGAGREGGGGAAREAGGGGAAREGVDIDEGVVGGEAPAGETEGERYHYQKPDDPYAIFNVLLWLGVTMLFATLAIIYACMDMDPGRDTIIYRLTTMKVKKEL